MTAIAGEPVHRRGFGTAAFVAFAMAAALGVGNALPTVFLVLPTFVLGCRYHELAHHRSVHRSGLLLLLIVWCVLCCGLLVLDQRTGPAVATVTVALCAVLLGLGVHLFVVQRRLQREQIANGSQLASEDGPDWACGGLLAGLAGTTAYNALGVMHEWRDPWALASAAVAGALLMMQLRCSRWFPSAAAVWFVAATGLEVVSAVRGDAPGGTAPARLVWSLATAVLTCFYLGLAPRMRRTFPVVAAQA